MDGQPRVVVPQEPQQQTENNAQNQASAGINQGLERFKIADYFGVDYADHKQMDTVEHIIRVAKENGAKSPSDMLGFIHTLHSRLGQPPAGMSQVQYFKNYLTVFLTTNNLQTELNTYVQRERN